MNRDQDIIALRPQLELPNQPNKTAVATFLHEKLRPILKLQHPILVELIKQAAHYDQLKLESFKESEGREKLKAFLQKNNGLRNQLVGLTIGMFTSEELGDYFEMEKELKRRMTEMMVTRFLSSIY